MTLGGKVLIVLVIVAATAVGLVLTEAVATSAHQTDRQGVVSLHQHGGVAHGARVFPFVHLARLHRHRSGPTL